MHEMEREKMYVVEPKKKLPWRLVNATLLLGLAFGMLAIAPSVHASDKKDKKKDAAATAQDQAPKTREESLKYFYEHADFSKIVWPNPPAITRIRYVNYWSGEKLVDSKTNAKQKKKSSWMERVAGVTTGETAAKPRWQLVVPNGVSVDSKGKVYVADSKVRAIFIVDPETGSYEMIKNGTDAKFQWLTGLLVDDTDRLFVSDSGMKRVMVFDPQHKLESTITARLMDPGGMAIDEENRLLYVTDAEQDLVQVYDADPPYKYVRSLGKEGTKHTSNAPGEFAKPTAVAVDKDGNVYVSDTWNDRIEVFDAEGNFVRTFGKAGDGPGYFARPKGISIDGDGHLWICDQVQDRVQVFTPEGRLLIYLGEHGLLPGQFQSLINIAVDKNNRVFTTEQMPGRLQMFRYITDAEAKSELDRRNEEIKKKNEERLKQKASSNAPEPPSNPEKK
jgi:sugar lactone lactonase YvrE